MTNENIRIGSNSYEKVKNLQIILTNQTSTHEQIKCKQNKISVVINWHFASQLFSKNLKIEIYKTIILAVVLYGCETWSCTLMEEY